MDERNGSTFLKLSVPASFPEVNTPRITPVELNVFGSENQDINDNTDDHEHIKPEHGSGSEFTGAVSFFSLVSSATEQFDTSLL